MEPCKDPISVRVSQLNSQLVSTKLAEKNSNLISREGLLDALNVLYEECNSDCLKKYDLQISAFVEKQRKVVNEVKGVRVNITDFEVRSVIGRGYFGEVHVVREKQTGDIYAMKTVKKSMCLTQKNMSFEEERNIMAHAGSQWLTCLQYAFQDSNHLYFIMEYHPGGDLLGLLHRQGGTIPESAAGFYVAELVLALHDLHSMGYVHRDVKPDNILLDRCGHIKLADFGSSAKLNSKGFVGQKMPVGTPDYIAPEVLQSSDNRNSNKECYGIACDYWSIGILAYQLTVGTTPFSSSNTTNTYSKIMNFKCNLKFPPDIVLSQAYVLLIKELLTEPNSRLNYEQILKHSLFKKLDFNGLRNQVPPYVPKIESVDDTSNFFDIPTKKTEPDIENFKTKTQFSGRHLPFVGFTYIRDLYEYKRNYPSHTHELVKNEQVESLQKEVNALAKKLMQSQELVQSKENAESKLEDKSRKLDNLESLRDRLERDLANTLAENSALKRTLELERKDRAELERKALELIKSAKHKWENSEKTRVNTLNLELTQQKEKIQQLAATNTLLNEQLQHALQLENKHKTSVENVQHLNRQSIVGLESRLDKITLDTQNKISELQNKLADETHQKAVLQNHISTFQYTQAALKEKLKSSEENCNGLLIKLEANQKLIRELENKISIQETSSRIVEEEKSKAYLLEEQMLKLKNDQKLIELEKEMKKEKDACVCLQKQIHELKEELNNSTVSREVSIQEQKDIYIKQLKEVQEELSKTFEEKNNLQTKLLEAKANEQTNKVKVQTLEDLLQRLESGVSKLENDCDKDNILKEQIERLEQQLIQVHKNAAVEKQELTQLKSKFWRMEKDLSNAEIDKRIYKRELKEYDEEKKKLLSEVDSLKTQITENVKMQENALLELSSMNEDLANEVDKLQKLIKHLESKVQVEKEKYDEEKNIISELKTEIDRRDSTIAAALKDIEVCKHEKLELNRNLDIAEKKQNIMSHDLELQIKQNDLVNSELENCQRQLQNTQLNLDALREACTLLENQLIEYESIHASYESKQKSLNINTEKLIGELAQAKEEIQQTKKLVNEERSSKIMAEIKCKRLIEDIECLRNECSAYKQQCIDFRQYSSDLTDELASSEEKVTDYEVTIKSYERQISNMLMENKMLKEESSAQLTHLNEIKGSNYELGQQLSEYKRTKIALLENINQLQETLEQKNNFYKERELKADGTIQQQTKLIDFLQSKVDECKKKKTLSDKLFGHCKKENQPPIPLNYKDLENLLYKERDINKELREEICKVKSELNIKLGKDARTYVCETLNTPMSPRTKVTLEKLAQSPNTQKNDLLRKNSTQRMYHNIPHRFESKLCTKTTKCTHCSNQMILGRNTKFCTECHVTVHPNCAKYLPKTCGVPQAFVKHYSETLTKQTSTETASNENKEEKVPESVNVEGWVKIPISGNTGWDRHYACLTSSTLKIYAHPPNNSNVSAIQTLELQPPDSNGAVILEPVASEIGVPVATSDLPFIIKVEVGPKTTCWPPKSIILMTLSIQDKEKWFKALQAIFHRTEDKSSGELIMKYSNLHVNCIVDIHDKTKLLGTAEGLYSYHNNILLHIAGPLHIHQISIINSISMAVMIVSSNKFLITCDLNHLIDLTQCAACSKPTLVFQTVNINNLDGFHLFQASNSRKHPMLAIATSKQLIVMNYDYKQSNFIPVRVLDTAEPTSCILFTEHSLIVGANKFFEIDLLNFEADEFLDQSDKKLNQAIMCYRVGSFPLALFHISSNPIEYLLCFHEFAIFVDEFGRCSRVTEIKWSRLPQAIFFQAPYLYIVQFSSVEIFKIAADTCNIMKNSMESLLNVDSVKIEYKNPRYLGPGKRGIYISLSEEIRYVEGKHIDGDSISLISETVTDLSEKQEDMNEDESSEFSFTSSMVQSLDGNLSDLETESTESPNTLPYQQKRVTFDAHVTDL